jgi:Lipocalin-like domain
MKRFKVLCLAVSMLGLALLPGSVVAQQKSLREQLVGAWELVSCDRTTANAVKQPYCANPTGILILDASGRYAHIIAAGGRPKLTAVNRVDTPADQYKAAAQGFVANFGTWSVNEAGRTITRHYEAALLPNYEGRDVKNSVNIAGDELRLVDPNPPDGFDQGRMVTVYRRVR